MIIKTVHIDRFGGLRGKTVSPGEGVSVLFGPNESGKSSLAAFVKFVLYGLPARDRTGNPERGRAFDRETGSAAGWLDIRCDDGTEFRIERAAATGETGTLRDRVRVINRKTGEVVEGQNPGELFFGVPEEVFSASAYVRQDLIRPDVPGGTGSGGMRGAVENLLTSADETVDLRRAGAKLDELRRELAHRTGGGGEIPELAEKRAALLAERNSAAAKTSEILSLSVSLDDIKRRIGELEADRARYAGIFDSLAKITVKRRIDAAEETESQLRKVRASLAALDPEGTSLTEDGFDEILAAAERDIRAYDEQRIAFRERFPGERDIPDKLRPYPFGSDTEEGGSEEEEKPAVPEDGPIPASVLSADSGPGVEPYEDTGALRMAGELILDGADENTPDPREAIADAKRLASLSKWEFAAGIFFAALALLGLGLSIGLSRTDLSPIPFLVGTLVLMTCALAAVVAHVSSSARLNEILSEWNAESADEIEIAVQEHLNTLERQNAGEKERRRLSAALESARVRRNHAAEKVARMADKAGISPREDIYETLRLLRRKNDSETSDRRRLLDRRSQLEGRLGALKEQLSDVDVTAAENDARDVLGTVWGREAASLTQAEMKTLMKERDFTESALRSAQLRRAALEEKLGEVGKVTRTTDELDTMIAAADERLGELSLRRDALDLAASALKRAGESLREGVIPRIAASASKRLCEVTENWDSLLLDDRLSCSLSSAEKILPGDLLSRGTADLAWLSLRLALTEELFRAEKPPVLFDESFAHMDSDRAARFLSTLSSPPAFQTLVFTCREDEADAARELGCPVIELAP